ncbi:MAG: hypothetical protein HY913_04415 [Desulfomonile tiedjei]|nr:hypothetical protein [Desulfomonile tiedjei]
MLSEFEPGILEIVGEFFSDPELRTTINYRLYIKTERGVESTNTFTLPAIRSNFMVESVPVMDGTKVQSSLRQYIIREADLPQGVTRNSLGRNDKIIDGTQTLDIIDINKDLGFVIQIITQGA